MTTAGKPATTAASASGLGTSRDVQHARRPNDGHLLCPNDLGRAWTLFNADAPPGPVLAPTLLRPAARFLAVCCLARRSLSSSTIRPNDDFFRGYTVRFNTGGGNTVYAGVPQSAHGCRHV